MNGDLVRRLLPLLVAALLGAGLSWAPAALGSTPAVVTAAPPTWAPVDDATIRPGSQTRTAGGQCTSNFVFYDDADIYIGQAAHCAGTGDSTQTNGCRAPTLPIGTPVEVEGATQPGTMAYSSWVTMQATGETDPNACANNDLALIRLHPADHGRVNPTIPIWGGPTGITSSTAEGEDVYSYGSSSLRLGLRALSPKQGVSLGQLDGGWRHRVYTVTPGIPGDSGSAFIDAAGRAFGVLSTIELLPVVASNGVSDLSRMLDHLASRSDLRVTLALASPGGAGGGASSADPRTARACPEDDVPPGGYDDTEGNPHRLAIDCVTWWEIAAGVAADRYAPRWGVRRDQMASFTARSLEAVGVELPPPRDQGYRDIQGNPHEDRINQLSAIGVVRGTSGTTYSPGAVVRRDQMASFIVRAVEHATGEAMPASRDHFTDTAGNPHREAINKVAEAGIAAGTSAGTYSPAASVRRDQMATFLARTLDLFVRRGDARPPSR